MIIKRQRNPLIVNELYNMMDLLRLYVYLLSLLSLLQSLDTFFATSTRLSHLPTAALAAPFIFGIFFLSAVSAISEAW